MRAKPAGERFRRVAGDGRDRGDIHNGGSHEGVLAKSGRFRRSLFAGAALMVISLSAMEIADPGTELIAVRFR
jgi:hypothetical protein